jgi:hypothetical protein
MVGGGRVVGLVWEEARGVFGVGVGIGIGIGIGVGGMTFWIFSRGLWIVILGFYGVFSWKPYEMFHFVMKLFWVKIKGYRNGCLSMDLEGK